MNKKAPIENKEKKKPKVAIHDFSNPDIFYVKGKDPDYYYRHAEDNPLSVQKWKRRGFEVVTGTQESGESADSPMNLSDKADSGFVNIPGHILMRCPKDINDARVEANRQRFEALREKEEREMQDVSRALKRLGGRIGKRFDREGSPFLDEG